MYRHKYIDIYIDVSCNIHNIYVQNDAYKQTQREHYSEQRKQTSAHVCARVCVIVRVRVHVCAFLSFSLSHSLWGCFLCWGRETCIQGQPHWNASSPGTLYTPNGTCIHQCWDYFRWWPSMLRSDQITTHCNVLQRIATQCNALQHAATHYNTLNDDKTCFDQTRVWHTATHCSATWCNTLQHTTTHCNTLQHAATLWMTTRAAWIKQDDA